MSQTTERYLGVSRLVRLVRENLEADFRLRNVWVVGEISNFTRHRNGHWYLSLKDDQSRIDSVMFQSQNRNVVDLPKDGDQVLVSGSINVFEGAGRLQLIIRTLEPYGLGVYFQKLELLKRKLSTEGLFDQQRKKRLPVYPFHIGIITAVPSAALTDIERTLALRWPCAQYTVFPAMVQGEQAPSSLITALLKADQSQQDVLIIARGGGSIEDLIAFNDEQLIRTIGKLQTPLVSGVGHERDITLTDYIADLRAATPTAAVQLATPDYQEVLKGLTQSEAVLTQIIRKRIQNTRERYAQMVAHRVFRQPELMFQEARYRLELAQQQLVRVSTGQQGKRPMVASLVARLEQQISTRLIMAKRTDELDKSLEHQMIRILEKYNRQFEQLRLMLLERSPLRAMERGYALVFQAGKLIRRSDQLSVGDPIDVRMAEGSIQAIVTNIDKETEESDHE